MSISGKQAYYYQHQSYSSIYFRENGTCQKRTDSSEEQAFELMLSKHLADELHLHTRQTLFYKNHEEPIADFIEEFQSQRQPTTPVIRTKNRPGTSSMLQGAPRKGYFRLYQKGEFRSRFANKDVHEFNKVKNKTHPLEVQIIQYNTHQMSESVHEKHLRTKVLDTIQPFVIGGFSGCFATCFIQPVDLIKVRIQLKSEALGSAAGKQISPFFVLKEIYQQGGVLSFWKGIDSALARQVFYTTTRMGIYKSMYAKAKAKNGGKEPSIWSKLGCSIVAGFVGSIAGNPADLALVRIQADSTLPLEDRRGYKNVFDAFYKIVRDEGVLALWRGSTPTVVRAIVINMAMLGPYDELKERLNIYFGTKDTQSTRLLASAGAGFLSSFLSLPFDNAKTKMQKMKQDAAGKYPYSSIFDAIAKTARKEGIKGLWVGFPTFYFRIAPHTMITLITQDYLTDYITRYRKAKH